MHGCSHTNLSGPGAGIHHGNYLSKTMLCACSKCGRGAAHLLGEAHLQQAVCLVEHKRLQVLEPHRLAVAQVVNQAPLCTRE